MAMNRETKRMLQRQGQLGADGAPDAPQRRQPRPRRARQEKRTGPRQFVREVRAELRKVAWPTRAEVINYSIIVLVTARRADRADRRPRLRASAKFVLCLFDMTDCTD